MKYEIWQSDESGFDAHVKTFTDYDEAYEYMRRREYYNPGYHFRMITVKD